MLEQMFVAGEQQPHVVLAEQRHPLGADRRRLVFDLGAAMRAGRERRVMEEHRDVHVPPAIESLELRLDPCELDRVVGDVGVERDEERVAVAERVRRIAVQPSR